MAALNVSDFIIDPIPVTESPAIIRYGQYNEKRKEDAYREQKDLEQQQWKKLGLIQDLTDLSKHQTGSDIANAIGNQHANEIFKKYTAAAGTMSPAQLQYNISKDMASVTNGMDAMKNELTQSDQALAVLKQKFPSLDTGTLAKQLRADVLNRRLKNANEFNNPLEVPPSNINLSNPDFLSRYITGNKSMTDEITNPKGTDEVSVFKGTPNQYTKYTAKIPYWKKPNFDQAALNSGFLPKNIGEPSLGIKGSVLPPESLPSSNGKPFNVVDQDVYNRFTEDEGKNLELTKATRDAYPDYDKFNQTEKDYAKRNVLYNNFAALDQSQFHPTEVHNPSASLLKFYAGQSSSGGSGSSAQIHDVYKSINDKIDTEGKDLPFGLGKGIPFNQIEASQQKAIIDLVGSGYDRADMAIIKNKDGGLNVVDKNDGSMIAPLDFAGVNIKSQPSVKEKRAVINQANKTYNYNGHTYTHDEIQKAANAVKMSIEDYTKKYGIK